MSKVNGSVLVIVESPTKAKTIRKFLPKDFVVEASIGHVRDLPQSAADIPAALKKEAWAKIGVNVEHGFEPLYVIPKTKTKVISELKKKLKEASVLYLATDEDREGESISWHLSEILKPKIPVKRMVFHEITKTAIEKALKDTRAIDQKLVRAQETRRILDRLVGYTISPLLWKKIAYGLSAGRVQSVGLRLIVDREKQRLAFKKAEYWDLEAELLSASKKSDSFKARITTLASKRIASGKDFNEQTGELFADKKKEILLLSKEEAETLQKKLKTVSWKVISLEERPLTNKPAPPFITSTLQQEANRKLGLSSKDAMRTAQSLYEQGFITYMRTDSPSLSQEAIRAARETILDLYGKEYLSPESRQYSAKSKGAQEAHEAIRPAGSEFVHPKETGLSGRELSLYELIWKRTVATQMAEAQKLSLSVKIEAVEAQFTATGTRIMFAGFLRVYVEGSDDPEAALEDREVILPPLKEGEILNLKDLEALMHETKPPARFTEASLVQILEKEGVGRPSTYASILSTIMDRGYVRKVGNALIPTFTGFAVTQLLEKHFSELVDPAFTSQMEAKLDDIASGELESQPYLEKFYLGKAGLAASVKSKEKQIDANESRSINLPNLKGFEVRIGRFGPYIHKEGKKKDDEAIRASIPENLAPADLNLSNMEALIEQQEKGPTPLGTDPATGQPIYALTGRYGPYFQLGNVTEENPKPKRSSLPKGVELSQATLELALEYLSLPKTLGEHPSKKKPVIVNLGRFGPYVGCDGDFRSLKKDDNIFTTTLERALELLAQEKSAGRGGQLIRALGEHPKDGKPVQLYNGRYGFYVKHQKTNAGIPKDADVDKVDLKMALTLLSEKPASKFKKRK